MLTECQRAQIVALHGPGKSWKMVSQEMFEKFGFRVTPRGCQKIAKKWRERQTVSDLPRPGRPRLLNNRGNNILRRPAFKNRRMTARQLSREISHVTGRIVSKQTVLRAWLD